MTDKQKDAVRRIFIAWCDEPRRFCVSRDLMRETGIDFKGSKIEFSNPKPEGSFYFKVTPPKQRRSFIGIVYSNNIWNNYECVDFFRNPKVAAKAKKTFKELGIMELNKEEFLGELEYPKIGVY